MNILLIEDDSRISDFLIKGLSENRLNVQLAKSAEKGLEMIKEASWDIILLDIMLPEKDGIQFTQILRYKKNLTPILAISALDDPRDKIRALDAGADDYLSKPFHFDELLARIQALTRRSKIAKNNVSAVLTLADLSINLETYEVKRNGQILNISAKEFKLLQYLLEHQQKVLSRTQLLHAVWGIQYNHNSNMVDVYVSYLRNKIDAPFQKKLLHTVKGVGYVLREPKNDD